MPSAARTARSSGRSNEGYVHATPAVVPDRLRDRLRRGARGIRVSDGKAVCAVVWRYTGASPLIVDGAPTTAPTTARCWLSTSRAKRSSGATSTPTAALVLLSAALSGRAIVLGGRDKLVHAIDRQSGKVAWTFRPGRGWTRAVGAGGGSTSGRTMPALLLDAARGKRISDFEGGGPLRPHPRRYGRVVVGSQDGSCSPRRSATLSRSAIATSRGDPAREPEP